MQCYTYYHRYPLDRPFYKILVRTRSPGGNGFSHTGSSSIPLGRGIVVRTDQSSDSPSRLTSLSRLLEAAHSFLISHFFYHYVIANWGQTIVILTEPIVWSVAPCVPRIPVRLGAYAALSPQGHWGFRSSLAQSSARS